MWLCMGLVGSLVRSVRPRRAAMVLALLVVALPGANAETVSSEVLSPQWVVAEVEGRLEYPQGTSSTCTAWDNCGFGSGPAQCRLWEWYDDDPQVSIDPLLGLIVLDPDGCLRRLVQDPLGPTGAD